MTEANQLALQVDSLLWDGALTSSGSSAEGQLWIPGVDVARRQRPAVQASDATVAIRQRGDYPEATVFRRAKDRRKDNLKTHIETRPREEALERQYLRRAAPHTKHPLIAGAARPVARKYERLSQN